MATILGKAGGKISEKIIEIESAGIFTSPLNKLWRAKILLNRKTSPMPKDDQRKTTVTNDDKNLHYATEDSKSEAQKEVTWVSERHDANVEAKRESRAVSHGRNNFKIRVNQISSEVNNQICIINKHTSPPTVLTLQNRPPELNVTPGSTWVAVKSMGRNNPFMMYTGGEDTISFEISWFVSDPTNREEVITKCRLLESWTKADGYNYAPPTLKILWGASNLFLDDLFILESAPYKLTNFQNATRVSRYSHTEWGQRNPNSATEIIDLKLLPTCATQTLTFKRVSSTNRTHVDIISDEALKKTKGISFQTEVG